MIKKKVRPYITTQKLAHHSFLYPSYANRSETPISPTFNHYPANVENTVSS